MLASRGGRVGGVAVAIAALASAWLIGRRSAPEQASIAAPAVQAVLDGRAGPLRALETRMLPVPDYARDIGTAHPSRVRAAARSGRWVIVCQARAETDGEPGIAVWVETDSLGGDRMEPYFIRGGGEGEAIDGYVAHSRDGRWIVLLRDNELVLVDDERGTASLLAGAEVHAIERELVDLATFSDDSQRLVYLRAGSGARTLVVRTLALQRELEVATPRRVLAVTPEPDGRWVRVQYSSSALDAALDAPPSATRLRTWRTTPLAQRPPLRHAETQAEVCEPGTGYHDHSGPQAWLALDTGALVERPDALAQAGAVRTRDEAPAAGLRIDGSGRVLMQSPQHGDPRNELALGPLRWVAPPVGR